MFDYYPAFQARLFTIGVYLLLLVLVILAEICLFDAGVYFLTHLPSVPSMLRGQIISASLAVAILVVCTLGFRRYFDPTRD